MRILIDMNLSPRWSAVMRTAGFEAVHWSTIGPFSAPDVQIMLTQGALLTIDATRNRLRLLPLRQS